METQGIVSTEATAQSDEAGCRAILDALGDAVLVHDAATGEIREVNRKFCELLGYSPEEARQLNIRDLVGEGHFPQETALDAPGPPAGLLEWQVQDRSGRQFWVEACLNRTMVNGREQVCAVLRDLGQNRPPATQPREQESFYRLLTEGSLAGLYLIQDDIFRYVNPMLAQKFGYRPEEIIDRLGPQDMVQPEDSDLVADNIRRRLSQEEAIAQYCFRGRRRDGSTIHCEILSRYTEYRGRPAAMGILLDITERVQVEQALKASEERYRAIVEDQTELVTRFLPDTTVTFANEANCRYFGVAPEEFRRGSFLRVVHEEDWHLVNETVAGLHRDNPIGVVEHRVINGEGEVRWQQWINRAICDDQGRILEYQGVGRDITERKVAEEALKEAQELFRQMADNLEAVFWMRPLNERKIIFISTAYERIWGRTIDSLMERPETWLEAVHPEDREHLQQRTKRKSAEEFGEDEFRIIRPDGQVRWINSRTFPVRDGKGEVYRVAGISVDITEHKRAEEDLREANDKLRALVQASPLAIVGLDLQGKVMSWNSAAESIFGWRQDEVIGRHLPIVPLDRVAEFQELHQRELRGERLLSLELRRQRKDGSPVDISLSTAPLYDANGNLTGFVGIIDDITTRKRTEEAMRTSEAKYRNLVEQIPAITYIAGLDDVSTALYISPPIEGILGFTPEQWLADPEMYKNRLHPEDRDRVLTELLLSYARGGPFAAEYRMLSKSGRVVWIRDQSRAVYDSEGRPLFMQGVALDITKHKRAEEATEEIKRQQDAILNNIAEMAWLKDRESRFIVVNETMARACGVAPGDLVGKTDLDTWPREIALKYQEDDREVMRTGKRKRLEEPLVDGAGNLVWLETIKTPIFNERQEVIGTAGTARDVTERRRMEETLRKVSRALKAVTECHQAMLRATNEAELLSEVCRIIVEVGGYRMAWVGFAQPDEEKSVQPMAQQGFEDGYVQTLRLSWADTEWGRGPVGTAIRTGKPAITRDTKTEPRFAPWREEACKRGYASVLGLPLVDAQPFGALAIYAAEANAFDDEEINLLIGLANDLAYGIKALRAGAERRRVEEALRQSEQKYRSLMDGASDAIVLADPRGRITEANQRAEDLLGYSEAELLGLNYNQIHPSDKLDHVLENFEKILTTGSGPLHECAVRRKDGQTVPVEIAHIMVGSGDNQVIQAVFRDVAERKRAGEALRDSEQKLRLLASQLLAVQEKERRRVSHELHDELGQALTVLKIHLVAIENKLRRDQQGLKLNCERLLGYIDTVIENVRRLSWDLSPSILEDLGLSSSLKYLVQEICRNNNMLYSVAVDEIDNLFSPEVKINIYRIFQESLTNIVRHAQAGRINVEIMKQKDRVTFLLRDNGLGFDVKEARSRNLDKRGLGLTTMQERALMAGGTLSISSHKGQGTDVILTIPFQR